MKMVLIVINKEQTLTIYNFCLVEGMAISLFLPVWRASLHFMEGWLPWWKMDMGYSTPSTEKGSIFGRLYVLLNAEFNLWNNFQLNFDFKWLRSSPNKIIKLHWLSILFHTFISHLYFTPLFHTFISHLYFRTQFVVSSWKTSQKTDYNKMYNAIKESLDKIRQLCHVSKIWNLIGWFADRLLKFYRGNSPKAFPSTIWNVNCSLICKDSFWWFFCWYF